LLGGFMVFPVPRGPAQKPPRREEGRRIGEAFASLVKGQTSATSGGSL
jgi:hypothetical protein